MKADVRREPTHSSRLGARERGTTTERARGVRSGSSAYLSSLLTGLYSCEAAGSSSPSQHRSGICPKANGSLSLRGSQLSAVFRAARNSKVKAPSATFLGVGTRAPPAQVEPRRASDAAAERGTNSVAKWGGSSEERRARRGVKRNLSLSEELRRDAEASHSPAPRSCGTRGSIRRDSKSGGTQT